MLGVQSGSRSLEMLAVMKDIAGSSGRSSQPYRETSVPDIHVSRTDTTDSCRGGMIREGSW